MWGFFGVVFTALCAVVSNILVSKSATKDLYAKLDKQSELSDAKIDKKIDVLEATLTTRVNDLADEVRKHNEFAERIPRMEADIENIKRQTW